MINNNPTFKNSCKVINLKREYPGLVGDIQWVIISAFPEKELYEKFPDELSKYLPFTVITPEMYQPIVSYKSNDTKHHRRAMKSEEALGYIDGQTETMHHEAMCFEETAFKYEDLYNSITALSPIQKSRIADYFFLGLTMEEIATKEGVSKQAVSLSINSSLKILRKSLVQP